MRGKHTKAHHFFDGLLKPNRINEIIEHNDIENDNKYIDGIIEQYNSGTYSKEYNGGKLHNEYEIIYEE